MTTDEFAIDALAGFLPLAVRPCDRRIRCVVRAVRLSVDCPFLDQLTLEVGHSHDEAPMPMDLSAFDDRFLASFVLGSL